MTPLTSSLPDYGYGDYSNVTNCTETLCAVSVDSVNAVNAVNIAGDVDVAFYIVIITAAVFTAFCATFLLWLLFRTRQQMANASEQWQRAAEENAAERDWWRAAWNAVTEDAATLQEKHQEELAASQTDISTLKSANDEMNRRATAVSELEVFVRETSKVVQTLEDVAAETNHLALTAAMEAVKAGQHGRDFAMVAESIRSLASRSGDAALATAAFIKRGTRDFKSIILEVSHQ